jgi:tyrosinase
VVFSGVRCTQESYTIDAFLNQSTPTEADVDPLNPHYIGRFSRIGMGIEDDKGRCILHGVTRMLDATRNAAALGIASDSQCGLTLLVRNIASGERLTPAQYQVLPGFDGQLVWGRPDASAAPDIPPRPSGLSTQGGCCHVAS